MRTILLTLLLGVGFAACASGPAPEEETAPAANLTELPPVPDVASPRNVDNWAWEHYINGCANHWMPTEVPMIADSASGVSITRSSP